MNGEERISNLILRVAARRRLTGSIDEFDLRREDDGALPPFLAGGSLIVTTPSGERRNYSIVNDEAERHRYVVAIKREAGSRGGSRSMHDAASPGVRLQVELARHGLFAAEASHHLLIAGGIGITPILSLARMLMRMRDRSFRLIYLARSEGAAAYADELRGERFRAHVELHFTADHGGRRYDLGKLLHDNGDGTHLYYCGPDVLMDRLRLLSIHWPRSRVHVESFNKTAGQLVGGEPFQVRQATTGRVFDIGANETILETLRRHGIQPSASCESGTCGKCRMRLVAGEVDHHDLYLTGSERCTAMMPCVSRGIGVVELDF